MKINLAACYEDSDRILSHCRLHTRNVLHNSNIWTRKRHMWMFKTTKKTLRLTHVTRTRRWTKSYLCTYIVTFVIQPKKLHNSFECYSGKPLWDIKSIQRLLRVATVMITVLKLLYSQRQISEWPANSSLPDWIIHVLLIPPQLFLQPYRTKMFNLKHSLFLLYVLRIPV